MSPLSFSVIIPVYNNRETLARAVESVRAQTLAAHEIIVVDDGSTDGSAALAQSLFGDAIRLLVFPENRGPSAARNAGIEAAQGTHLAFLDADDYWLPEKLERIAAVLEAHPAAWLAFHDRTLIPEIPENSGAKRYPLWRFLTRNPVATPCAVVPKTALRFDERLRWMEDHDYFLRHAEAGPVYFLPQALTVLGRPILSAGGQSSRRWQMRKAEGQVMQLFAGRHPAFYPLLPFWMAAFLAKHLYQEIKGNF